MLAAETARVAGRTDYRDSPEYQYAERCKLSVTVQWIDELQYSSYCVTNSCT
jgi:hypothetical protein